MEYRYLKFTLLLSLIWNGENINDKDKSIKLIEVLAKFKLDENYVMELVYKNAGVKETLEKFADKMKAKKDEFNEAKTPFHIICKKKCDIIIGRKKNFNRVSMKKNESCKLEIEKVNITTMFNRKDDNLKKLYQSFNICVCLQHD